MGRVWTALGTVYVVWGSTYLAIMLAIRTLPPLLMSSARFLVAGAVLFLWGVRRGGRPNARGWLAAGIVGGALLLVGNGGIAWAETRLDSGLAALLVAIVPIWVALLQWVGGGRRPSRAAVVGLAVGLGGVALLVGPSGSVDVVGAIAILLASLSWTAGSLYAARAPLPQDALLSAGMQMLAGGVLLGVAGGFAGEASHVQVPSPASAGAFVYLIVVGSIVAFTAYGWLLQNAATSLVATYAYVNPVVAVVLGAVVLHERLTATTAVAGAMIVAAVVLIVRTRRDAVPVPVEEPALVPALERAA